jgi:hypothetical protein
VFDTVISNKKAPHKAGQILKVHMKGVTARRHRRNHNFDLNAKRRKEIVQHALLVRAADTDDFPRWLIAWHWYNPKAADPIWSLMEAAKRMGGQLTEAQASAITKEASIIRKCWSADNLARFLGVTYDQRQALRLTTIGSVNVKKRAREELRKRRDRVAKEQKRRALGMRPQSESLSATKPWKKLGMSRAAWYRRNKYRSSGETTLSAAIFLSTEDRPVSPEGGAGLAERGFASKKARGLPSSQTATTMVAGAHEALPTELRLLALGLVETDWTKNLSRAA